MASRFGGGISVATPHFFVQTAPSKHWSWSRLRQPELYLKDHLISMIMSVKRSILVHFRGLRRRICYRTTAAAWLTSWRQTLHKSLCKHQERWCQHYIFSSIEFVNFKGHLYLICDIWQIIRLLYSLPHFYMQNLCCLSIYLRYSDTGYCDTVGEWQKRYK